MIEPRIWWKTKRKPKELEEQEQLQDTGELGNKDTWKSFPELALLVPITPQNINTYPGGEEESQDHVRKESKGGSGNEDLWESNLELDLLVPDTPQSLKSCPGGKTSEEDLLLGEQHGRLCLQCVEMPCICLLTLLETRLRKLREEESLDIDKVNSKKLMNVQEDVVGRADESNVAA